jgi:hypothetical protein
MVFPQAFLLQKSFLVPSLGYDVVPFHSNLFKSMYVDMATSFYIL